MAIPWSGANGEGYAAIGKDSLAVSRAILEKERGHAVSEIELRSLIAADYDVKAQFLIAVEQPGNFHIDIINFNYKLFSDGFVIGFAFLN